MQSDSSYTQLIFFSSLVVEEGVRVGVADISVQVTELLAYKIHDFC